jgi:hypothetical protein
VSYVSPIFDYFPCVRSYIHGPCTISRFLSSYCCSVWSPSLPIAVACGVKLVLAKSFPASFLVCLCSRFKECVPAACRSDYFCFCRSILPFVRTQTCFRGQQFFEPTIRMSSGSGPLLAPGALRLPLASQSFCH